MKNSEKAVSNSRFHQNIRVFFSRGFMSKICFGIIIVFVVLAVLAPVLAPYPPTEQSLTEALQKPSATHWFGTDNLGRDLLSRILYGARISLISSLLSSLIAAAIGTFLGLVAGYFGGLLSQVIMRVIDAQLSIPPLVLTIVLAMVFGGGITGVSVVIGLSMFPSYARVSYAQVLALKENDYVMAAQLVGQSERKIMFTHLLPNCFPSLIVLFTMNLGTAIMLEASMSYLGVGITPPTPAWGSMVSEGYKYLVSNPAIALLPGICVLLVVISFNIVGDSLRDALDPRLRGKL
ncbi:ABC transporter permease [Ruthenibacterium lactatiformans]|jgi:peptide/nickel transport system permease protein|uniref:ABC transporter permease n=1 Tax=Ruthenibacterium lactatiformans TaxID=1550024 RepID=UPI0022E4D5C0|nr:ABC transporter permease [Ruthenibacterium lactatiformans]